MAKIISGHERLVPTWLAALQVLKTSRAEHNLVLEISSPLALTSDDTDVINMVDAVLRERADLSVKTVASTIFPQGYARRHSGRDLYDSFHTTMARAKKTGTWGTYAMRLMRRPGKKKGTLIYPLEDTIGKLRKASTGGHPFRSVYEMGVIDPDGDLELLELPLFDPAIDGRKVSNMPCLSHLSFKLIDKKIVNLTAIYRSHYYCERALGNLVGLAQLLKYVADESKLTVGMLTCISTYAKLDLASWGGVSEGMALVKAIEER